ncbi:MAG: cyclase family protein [Chloroflexi bacterium]|nr:MAG: cyclase family protein [Chloroflexota bacterium]
MDTLASFVDGLVSGSIEVIDLTQPLSERTPMIQLPPPFANTPNWKSHEISRYDERGPAWYWNWFEGGEHAGTHFDAPIHWVTGKDKDDVSQVPVTRLIGPAVVIDKSKDSWLLYRTGWDARANDQKAFLNANETGPHTPGIDIELAQWLANESPFVGVGVETVGTDAGTAHSFNPPFPCHQFLLGANKYGLTQLANLATLPPTGAVLVVAPLKLVKGSGSPCRALALVQR